MSEFLQQLLNGLSLGAIYALIALGYTMVYGVLRFINFAHADVFMVGAFVGYYASQNLGAFIAPLIAAGFASLLIKGTVRLSVRRFGRRIPGWAAVLALVVCSAGASALDHAKPVFSTFVNENLPEKGLVLGILVFVCALLYCALLGMTIERLAYRPLRGSPTLNVLITAIGVSLLLEYSGQLYFGATPRTFPELFPSTNLSLGDLVISSNQVVVIVVATVLMVILQFIVHRTKMGTAMRAVSLNPKAAQLVGINNDVVISFTFALGSALAGAGGILYALNYPSIDPLMGVMPGLKAFVAAVLGGIGNIPGAALGGLLLGVVETFVNGSQWSTYKDAIAFAILIIILLFRPAGLLGKTGAEKV